MIRSRFSQRRSRALSSAILGAAVIAATFAGPVAVSAGHDPAPPAIAGLPDATPVTPADQADANETAAQHPSTAYEQAMAHAADRIDFVPGDRVDVPFSPRTGDSWPVDGHAPVALPGGRASGRDMATSPQGSRWAAVGPADTPAPASTASPTPTSAPVDLPGGGVAIPAAGASWVQAPAAVQADPAVASGLRRQVFGFLPYWELSGAASTLNYGVLSTIAYFSVGADSAGNLRKKNSDGTTTTGWGGWTSANLTAVINAAHQTGTRVVLTISVFAWTTGEAAVQRALLGSATARLNLAQQIAAAVRDRGADGVNLDFEPLVSGSETQFVALLTSIRSEMDKVHTGYQLTYDTTGYIGNYPLEASVAPGAADAIFVMGYDYRTASSAYAGSIDPLSGPVYDLTDTVRSYTARVAPSQVILGIPWYGRAWSTVSSALHAQTQSGEKYGYSVAVNYENIGALVAQYGRRWDSAEQSPYFVYQRQNCTTTYGCVTSWRQVYYDDADSLKLRFAVVNDYGLRGAGMWALGYDGGHAELYQAISDSFLADKTAPAAGITALPVTQGDEGFVVNWSGRDISSVTGYDVQVSVDGGAWTSWLTGTTATSDVWLGSNGHGYAFRVRATDSNGNVGSWDVTSTWTATPTLAVGGFGRVSTDGLSYRTGPATTNAKLGTLSAGTLVAVTGGPVSSGGYTWWEVIQPIHEWSPVSFVERGVWVASGSASDTYIVPVHAPNTTHVVAGLIGLDFGTSGTSVGTSAAAVTGRTFSPNGDGAWDTLRIRWTNATAMSALKLNVYRTNGTFLGSRDVPALAAGAHAWDWDGRLGGTVLPDGKVIVQLEGSAGSAAYRAPSARPVTPSQVAAYAVTIDTVNTSIQQRLGGANRYATAAAVSKAYVSPGVGTVFVATGANFPDALAGAAAAGAMGAPILLVAQDSIPAPTATELTRLKPAKIVILGATGVVSDAVAKALGQYAPSVTRLGGANRYATAAAVSKAYVSPGVGTVFVATGANFPDALAGAAAAGAMGAPILLVAQDSIPAPTATELTRLKPAKIVILGATGVVSDAVAKALGQYAPSVTRLGGANRYATAAAVSKAYVSPGVGTVFVATGANFPDALAGAAAAGAMGAPILLVAQDSIPAPTATEIARLATRTIVILGATGVVSDAVRTQLAALQPR